MVDIEYARYCGMFTSFMPVSKQGEIAWNQLAAVTDGTGKVLTMQESQTIKSLRQAGYKVRKAKRCTLTMDEILKELESL